MGIFNEFNKKEKPVFTGIARGVGGFAFGVSGIAEVSSSFTASGGVITLGSNSANGYTYHVFDQTNSPETFQVTDAGDNEGYIEVLVVGGGGGGGGRGGGGGAGGVRHLTYQVTGTATMPVTVGGGGGPGAGGIPGSAGATGGNSVFVNPLASETTTCGGGGGGGGGSGAGLSNTNGSAGGRGRDGNGAPAPAPNIAYGYPGGGAASNNNNGAGGGGGATGSGTRGSGPDTPMEGPGSGGYGVVYPGFGGTLISPPGTPNPRVPTAVRTAVTTAGFYGAGGCLLYTSPSPRDQ